MKYLCQVKRVLDALLYDLGFDLCVCGYRLDGYVKVWMDECTGVWVNGCMDGLINWWEDLLVCVDGLMN